MRPTQPGESPWVLTVLGEERRLRKELGFWSLTAIGFSNILGSGWLFAAMFAAQTAGPAVLLSWVAAGVLCALVALVMVELGATRPEGGGTVRWPLYASGRLVGTVIGWSVLLSVGGTAAEISAIMQYAAHYLPGLYDNGRLTGSGLAVATGSERAPDSAQLVRGARLRAAQQPGLPVQGPHPGPHRRRPVPLRHPLRPPHRPRRLRAVRLRCLPDRARRRRDRLLRQRLPGTPRLLRARPATRAAPCRSPS